MSEGTSPVCQSDTGGGIDRLKRLRYARTSLPGEYRDGAGRQKAGGVHSRGYLPHVEVAGAAYFVTFRLADSIPAGVLSRIQAEMEDNILKERERWKNRPGRSAAEPGEPFDESRARHRAQFSAMERWLNAGHGECWLAQGEIADMVGGALRYFADERYELNAWCVMPNHVHAVVRPLANWSLSKILHSWKSFTSKEAVKLAGDGVPSRFWMPESYNHWCRDEDEVDRCCQYTRRNPVAAGLCKEPGDWPWRG